MKWNSMFLTNMSTVNHNNLKYAPFIKAATQIKLTYYTDELTQINGIDPKKTHKNNNGKWTDNNLKKENSNQGKNVRLTVKEWKASLKSIRFTSF